MANVDKCAREAELALCENLDEHINNIIDIEDKFKVKCFRNKTYKEIENILTLFKNYIMNTIKETYNFSEIKLEKSNNSNFDAADLYCINNNKRVDIEVKFGAETNSNVGMRVINNFFNTDLFKECLNNKTRKEWKTLMIEDNLNEDNQLKRLSTVLNITIDRFNDEYGNKPLTNEQIQTLNTRIINNSGSASAQCENYIKFSCLNGIPKEIKTVKFSDNNWKILPINNIDNNHKRLIIHLSNNNDEMVSFTLNWKNNYKIKDVGEISAKCGLGSPSWIVNVGKNDDESE